MTSPKRIQMTRQRPWRAEHPDAVIVDRRTKWGNPFQLTSVNTLGAGRLHRVSHNGSVLETFASRSDAARDAVRRYLRAVELGWGDVPWPDEIRAELAGRDLACWCPLDQPCHAGVLLELANPKGPSHA